MIWPSLFLDHAKPLLVVFDYLRLQLAIPAQSCRSNCILCGSSSQCVMDKPRLTEVNITARNLQAPMGISLPCLTIGVATLEIIANYSVPNQVLNQKILEPPICIRAISASKGWNPLLCRRSS